MMDDSRQKAITTKGMSNRNKSHPFADTAFLSELHFYALGMYLDMTLYTRGRFLTTI